MANAEDDRLLQSIREYKERNTVTVETIASDARSGGTLLTATLRGRVQFSLRVPDSSTSRSAGSIS